MKNTSAIILGAGLWLSLSGTALAGACIATNGTQQYNFNYSPTITEPSQNTTGFKPPAWGWALGTEYYATCSCSGSYMPVYYKAVPALQLGHADASGQYYIINEYLEAAFQVYIKGRVMDYIRVPFENFSNQYNTQNLPCNTPVPEFESGSQGRVQLYFRKSFVGAVPIPTRTILEVYGATNPGGYGGTPMSRVTMGGTVTVPQSCDISAGTVLDIDFGDMNVNDFGARGTKPTGVNVVRKKLNVTCSNIADGVYLDMRFVAESSAYPNAVKTSNPNIGVALEDDQGRPIVLNTGTIPVDFNYASSTGSVTINTYPISATSVKPAVGAWSGTATIRIDFR